MAVGGAGGMQKKLLPASKLLLAFWSVGAVVGQFGIAIAMPLLLATFPSDTGPFVVLFICSFLFCVAFCSDAVRQLVQKKITADMHRYVLSVKHYKFFLIGFCNAMNGFLVVYSSPASRVPPDLQPVLMQSVIPLILVLSYFMLGKRYNLYQVFGAVIVMGGIFLSITPTLQDLGNHENSEFQSGAWWAVILIAAMIPGVVMNVIQESVFEDFPTFSVSYVLALGAVWQFLTIVGFFWMDILPNFGFSNDIAAWKQGFRDGMSCFFDPTTVTDLNPKCVYCAGMGLLFTASYSAAYVFGSFLFQHASANYNTLIASFGNPMAVIFWMIFPSINNWAGGPPYTTAEVAYSAGALPLILAGVLLFRLKESKKQTVLDATATDEEQQGLLAVNYS